MAKVDFESLLIVNASGDRADAPVDIAVRNDPVFQDWLQEIMDTEYECFPNTVIRQIRIDAIRVQGVDVVAEIDPNGTRSCNEHKTFLKGENDAKPHFLS